MNAHNPKSPAQRLCALVEPELEPGEVLLGAFLAMEGASPTSQMFWGFCGTVLRLFSRRQRRRWYVAAVTNNTVVLFKATGSGRPVRVVGRYAGHGFIFHVGTAGDHVVEIGPYRLWLYPYWAGEASRLRVITAERAPNADE